MTEIQGDWEAFTRVRGETMRKLISMVGGETGDGGPVSYVKRIELQPKNGHPDHRVILNYLVDAHDRALACFAEIIEPPRLEIRIAVYSEPRPDYEKQDDPLLEQLTHSQLN